MSLSIYAYMLPLRNFARMRIRISSLSLAISCLSLAISFLNLALILAPAGPLPKESSGENMPEESSGEKNTCNVTSNIWHQTWSITMPKVDDVDAVCHALPKSLKRYQPHCAVYKTNCGRHFYHKEGLEWEIDTNHACDAGRVASAFWEATHNRFGPLDLQDGKC
jgi:hypothetical protein